MAVSVMPTGDIPLRHGYTLASIHELTLIAVHCELFYRARDYHERVDIAWSAIAEHLYASEQPPSRSDLIHAGMSAIASLFVSEARSHGINTSQRGRTAVPGTNFQKYWHLSTRPTDGPEERIIERIALTQIWVALSPRLRDAFTALAVHDDYGRAAAAVGKTRDQYNSQLSYARRVFLALWQSTRRHRARGDTTGAAAPTSPRATLPASCGSAAGLPTAAPPARARACHSPKMSRAPPSAMAYRKPRQQMHRRLSGKTFRPPAGISAAHHRSGAGNHTFPPQGVTRRSLLCQCVNLAGPRWPSPAPRT